jgi:hypothetical protein
LPPILLRATAIAAIFMPAIVDARRCFAIIFAAHIAAWRDARLYAAELSFHHYATLPPFAV